LHETLRELLDFQSDQKPVGLSLFHKIPKNRDCVDARIPINHCTCQEKVDETLVPDDIKNKMFAELKKYVDYKAKRLKCVKDVKIHPPRKYTPYTINSQVRMGVRIPSMWANLIKNNVSYHASLNEIFDVEFDVDMDLDLRRFSLRVRIIYYRNNGYMRFITEPLLLDLDNIFIIDDICLRLK
jgi:hypothetical protein